jgi:hypothetical protein
MNGVLDMDSLIAHMQEQVNSLHHMEEILDRQEAAVRIGDADAVLTSVSQIRDELIRRVQLEEARERMVIEWARELGCTPEEVTVSRLAQNDPSRSKSLQDLSDQLHKLATTVQAKQEYCRALLRSELQFVSHLVDAMYPGRNSGAYTPGSQLPAATPALSLDVRG